MKPLSLLSFIILSLFMSCDKDNDVSTTPSTCDVKGSYSGTATPSVGSSSPMIYQLRDNNFAVGYVTVGGPAVTFGGYRNTCDSVIISSYYTGNGSYYLLKGAFNSQKTVLSGTFQNQTNALDFGTFSMAKQ